MGALFGTKFGQEFAQIVLSIEKILGLNAVGLNLCMMLCILKHQQTEILLIHLEVEND